VVDLIENGFDVISADDHSRSLAAILNRVEQITGRNIRNYHVNLCEPAATRKIFEENPDIKGIIHFAAFKTVDESVQKPLMYFHNNLFSLINLLQCAEEFKVPNFVFSSSCTVYGNPDEIPVTEETPMKQATSPYGATKQMGEEIVGTCSEVKGIRSVLLRYFNPVGAHPSALIGELPIGKPSNLVPAITQTAVGKWPEMKVHGNDYPTRDGSCIRDYIHVCDIAHAHTLALRHLMKGEEKACDIFNLGSGNGQTVMEIINSFEKVSGQKLNYSVGPRRAGDVIAIYSDNRKAKETLAWNLKYSLEDMMQTAWQWELGLKQNPLG
jgi:UDP-glucose 4-epimerase